MAKNSIPNLTRIQAALVKKLTKNEMFKTIPSDKNCGFSIIKTEHLTEHGSTEHLNDVDVYQMLLQ